MTAPEFTHDASCEGPDGLRACAARNLGKHFTRAAAWRNAEMLIIERSEGCYLWDDKGRRYLDGLAGLFCVNMGHGRTDIAEAACAQMKQLSFATNWSAAHPASIRLAALLADLTPGDLGVTFFVNSGSEANESAIKFAREYHLITRDDRLEKVAEDIVAHFMGRGHMGKAMVVCIEETLDTLAAAVQLLAARAGDITADARRVHVHALRATGKAA